jgi:hypothetical protein
LITAGLLHKECVELNETHMIYQILTLVAENEKTLGKMAFIKQQSQNNIIKKFFNEVI